MGCCCSAEKPSTEFHEELIQNGDYVKNAIQHTELPAESRNSEEHVLLKQEKMQQNEALTEKNPESVEMTIEIDDNQIVEKQTPVSPSPPPSTPTMSAKLTPMLKRTSSMHQTKEHREFRIFLPVVDESIDSWLPADLIEEYKKSIDILSSTLRKTLDDAEVRDDTYLIAQHYFGLKYRDDEKLEMKVKTANKPIWMEKWSKVKFGKKEMKHYRGDIITYLKDVGHHDEKNDDIVDNPSYLTISKTRHTSAFDGISAEVCEVSVPTSQSKFDGKIKRQNWLSISIAGDSNAIEEFVAKQDELHSLWKPVQLAREIYNAYQEKALVLGFVVVVSGYPQWIRLIATHHCRGCSERGAHLSRRPG